MIDMYLRSTRGTFLYREDRITELLACIAKYYGIDITIVVIYSNKSKNEMVKIGNTNYVIWDLSYWQNYERYLSLLMEFEACENNKDNINTQIQLCAVLYRILSKNFINISELISAKLYAYSLQYQYESINHNDHSEIRKQVNISKAFVFIHELMHEVFSMREWYVKSQREHINTIIELILSNKSDELLNVIYSNSAKDILILKEGIISVLKQEDSNFMEETLADISAFDECIMFIRDIHKPSFEKLIEEIPYIRNSVRHIKYFNATIAQGVTLINEMIYFTNNETTTKGIDSYFERVNAYNAKVIVREHFFVVREHLFWHVYLAQKGYSSSLNTINYCEIKPRQTIVDKHVTPIWNDMVNVGLFQAILDTPEHEGLIREWKKRFSKY